MGFLRGPRISTYILRDPFSVGALGAGEGSSAGVDTSGNARVPDETLSVRTRGFSRAL